MELIKQFEIRSRRCAIRTDGQGSSLQKFMYLFKVAKKDFAFLTPTKVEVVHYYGTRRNGGFGLEFDVPEGITIPADYRDVERLERTL